MQLTQLQIQREVVIDAPVDVVWRTITEPDQIKQWFVDHVELDLKPGGRGLLVADRDYPVLVEIVEPPTRFAFRWNYPADETPGPSNSVLVEFTLRGEGNDRTRLRVRETGHGQRAWSDAEKQRYADEHNAGWDAFTERLVKLLAARPRG